MNEKAISLGVQAEFHDSWGFSSDNSITATGMAELSRALIMEYPEVLEITSKVYLEIFDVMFRNSNLLLGEYDGLDGLKTGFTNAAGRCLVATAYRDGRRIITVIMGATTPARYPETVLLLDYGFANAEYILSQYTVNQVLPNINFDNDFWSSSFALGVFDHAVHGRLSERRFIIQNDLQIILCLPNPIASPFFVLG